MTVPEPARWLRARHRPLKWVVPAPAVAQATIEVSLAGREVAVDVYRPDGPARGAAILSHGFTRSRTTLGGHAAALAANGILAVTPDMPYTFDFKRNAQGLSELVAMLRAGGKFGAPVSRVVLVGFSAGALSSLLAAGTPGVVGYVGLDPFDRVAPDRSGALGPRLRAPAQDGGGINTSAAVALQCAVGRRPLGASIARAALRPRDRGGVALRLRIAERLDVQARLRRNRSRAAGSRARNLDRGDGPLAAARGRSGDRPKHPVVAY